MSPTHNMVEYRPFLERWGTIAIRLFKAVTLLSILSAIVTIGLHFTTPSRYIAVARILPPFGEQDSLSVIQGAMGGYPTASWWEPEDTTEANFIIIGILRSDRVLDYVTMRLDLLEGQKLATNSDARNWLRANSTILQDPHKLIVIETVAETSELSAALANTYLEGLEFTQRSLRKSHRSYKLQQVEGSLKRNRELLIAEQMKFQRFKQKEGIVDIDSQTKATVSMLAQLKSLEAENLVEITASKKFMTEKHATVEKYQAKLDKLKELQEQLTSPASVASPLNLLDLKNLPDMQRQFLQFHYEIEMLKDTRGLLSKQLEVIRLQESGNFPDATVLDYATPPPYDSKTGVVKKLLITCVAIVFFYVTALAVIDFVLHFIPEYLVGRRLSRSVFRLLAKLHLEPMVVS